MNGLRMTQEQLDAAELRIKAACSVRTIRHMQTASEALTGQKTAKAARVGRERQRALARVSEAAVLRDCSRILDEHPQVAFFWRNNVGAMKMDNGRYVKFSFVGASDLMAVSKRGRFMAIECKSTGKKPTADQTAFLANVTAAGGFAVCVDHPSMLELALREL